MANASWLLLLDEILETKRAELAEDLEGYRNHVSRVLRFCEEMRKCDEEETEKLVVAGAFHDIAVWTDDTFDYLEPSQERALEYLEARGLRAWSKEIGLMITEHHKIRRFKDGEFPLVELFRRADLVDASWGMLPFGFRFGIPKNVIDQVRAEFPSAGFWRAGRGKLARWILSHPLDPLPMFRW